MNTAFLMPVVSQARYHKRIRGLTKVGWRVVCFSFERDYYPVEDPDFQYTSLGYIPHRSYHRRVFAMLRAVFTVRRQADGLSVIYAFGFDMLIIAWLAAIGRRSKPLICYEVGDVGNFLRAGLIPRFFRFVERWLLRRVSALILTAEGYYSGYYGPIQDVPSSKVHVIENKLEGSTARNVAGVKRSRNGVITIGYFGVLRCRKSWQILQEVVRMGSGRFRVVLRGLSFDPKDLAAAVSQITYMHYGGTYVSPDDLPEMYQNVDIIWAAHFFHSTKSFSWARANRFYEAGYFGVPMIAQAGTADALAVAKLDIGMVIDLADADRTLKRISNLDGRQLENWRASIQQAPRDTFMYSDEHQRLDKYLESLRGREAPNSCPYT